MPASSPVSDQIGAKSLGQLSDQIWVANLTLGQTLIRCQTAVRSGVGCPPPDLSMMRDGCEAEVVARVEPTLVKLGVAQEEHERVCDMVMSELAKYCVANGGSDHWEAINKEVWFSRWVLRNQAFA